jgi:hypothetical protein
MAAKYFLINWKNKTKNKAKRKKRISTVMPSPRTKKAVYEKIRAFGRSAFLRLRYGMHLGSFSLTYCLTLIGMNRISGLFYIRYPAGYRIKKIAGYQAKQKTKINFRFKVSKMLGFELKKENYRFIYFMLLFSTGTGI